MAENKDKPGEHIEELLSQLKGIFGHLSDTEKEEAKQKISPPTVSASKPATPPPTPAPPPVLSEPEPAPAEPPANAETSDLPPLEPWIPADPPPAAEAPAAPDAFSPGEVSIPAGAALVPTAIFYPTGRIQEAKIVAEKVERITPKFTKVSVVVNVQNLVAYDAKSDIKTAFLNPLAGTPIKAVFVLIEKALDDTRRKALIAELEPRGIYFQEIPAHQVEKKALYTDMLLGMVFFFDSQKPAPGESAS